MYRCLYRAEGLEGIDPAAAFRKNGVGAALAGTMERMRAAHLSLFAYGSALFLYYECLDEPVPPEILLAAAQAEDALAVWPGGPCGRRWTPMTDIFHYQRPVSGEHWRRKSEDRQPYGRLALLKPEEVASYVYYHYQYQEERPGDGDKYGIIGLHENVLFFYAEQPTVREPAPYEGKLNTALKPDNWQETMDPHFIRWDQAVAGQDIWRRLELVLEVRGSGSLGRSGIEG